MEINAMTTMAVNTAQSTLGAQVVSQTLDTMNNVRGSSAPVDQQTFGAAVVSKTLDYMNSGGLGSSGANSDYDFQTKVLSAAYSGVGTIVDQLA